MTFLNIFLRLGILTVRIQFFNKILGFFVSSRFVTDCP